MYLNKERLSCGSPAAGMLLLLACSTGIPSLFLPFWEGGPAEDILGIQGYPDLSATIWSFRFLQRDDIDPSHRLSSYTWNEVCSKREEQQSESKAQHSKPDTGFIPHGPSGSCSVITLMRTLVIVFVLLAPVSVAVLLTVRWVRSVILVLGGAVLAALTASLGFAILVLGAALSLKGLYSGPASQCLAVASLFAVAGMCLAVWTSSKAVQKPQERLKEEDIEEEFRKILERLEQQAEEEELATQDKPYLSTRARQPFRLTRLQSTDVAPADVSADADKAKVRVRLKFGSTKISKWDSKGADFKAPPSLKLLVEWGKGARGYGNTIPDALLEAAFAELDPTALGVIEIEELLLALRFSGFIPSEVYVQYMCEELRAGRHSAISLHEFVQFFRTAEELQNLDTKMNSKAAICSVLCQLCFFVHMAIIAYLVIAAVRSAQASSTQNLTAVQKSERLLLQGVLISIGVSFLLFFFTVVFIPLLRLSLGNSISAWSHHVEASLADLIRKRFLVKKTGDKSEVTVPDSVQDAPRRSVKLPSSAWGDEDETSESPRSSKSVYSRKSVSAASVDDLSPTSATSTRKSRRSVRFVRKPLTFWERTRAKFGLLKTGNRRVSVKAKDSKPPEPNASLDEGPYDAKAFEASNVRAMVLSNQVHTSYTPLQVRNLAYRPPPAMPSYPSTESNQVLHGNSHSFASTTQTVSQDSNNLD